MKEDKLNKKFLYHLLANLLLILMFIELMIGIVFRTRVSAYIYRDLYNSISDLCFGVDFLLVGLFISLPTNLQTPFIINSWLNHVPSAFFMNRRVRILGYIVLILGIMIIVFSSLKLKSFWNFLEFLILR